MPNFKTHVIFDVIPLPLVLVVMYLLYYGDPADLLLMVGFLGWWGLHTIAITPDVDTLSIPSQILGPIGWLIRTIFDHRGIFHSKIFWLFYFVLQYHFIGWWTLGGVYPIYCHLYLDNIVSGTKIYKNKIVRKINGLF